MAEYTVHVCLLNFCLHCTFERSVDFLQDWWRSKELWSQLEEWTGISICYPCSQVGTGNCCTAIYQFGTKSPFATVFIANLYVSFLFIIGKCSDIVNLQYMHVYCLLDIIIVLNSS